MPKLALKPIPTKAAVQEQVSTGHHEVLADRQLVPDTPEVLDPATDFDPPYWRRQHRP